MIIAISRDLFAALAKKDACVETVFICSSNNRSLDTPFDARHCSSLLFGGFRRITALIAIKYHHCVRPKMMSDIWHIRVTYFVICGIWRPDDSMQKVTAIHNKHAILWKLRLWLNFRLQ